MNFNNSINIIAKGLDLSWQKQKIISDNLVNVSTPGYKAKYVSFEDEMKQNLKSYENKTKSEIANAINNFDGTIYTSQNESDRLDGNNVIVEAENVELARTQIQYDYLVRQFSGQMRILQTVIDGRG